MVGIETTVEGGGACKTDASSVGWIVFCVVDATVGPGVRGNDAGSCVAENAGATPGEDSVSGT